jgi:hypothetical protein
MNALWILFDPRFTGLRWVYQYIVVFEYKIDIHSKWRRELASAPLLAPSGS